MAKVEGEVGRCRIGILRPAARESANPCKIYEIEALK
jgi:hypothetical protein